MAEAQKQQQIDRLSRTAHDTVDRAANAASQVAERVGEKAEELWAMQEDWVDGARAYVREHPVAALGFAVAAGYLLSILTRSR